MIKIEVVSMLKYSLMNKKMPMAMMTIVKYNSISIDFFKMAYISSFRIHFGT